MLRKAGVGLTHDRLDGKSFGGLRFIPEDKKNKEEGD